MQQTTEGLWEKALRRLAPSARDSKEEKLILSGKLSLNGDSVPETQVLVRWIDACLAEDGGQIAARERAATLGRSYRLLDDVGRARFLMLLVEEYSTDGSVVNVAIKNWEAAQDAEKHLANIELRKALEPPRMKLLAQLNSVPEGVKFLVDMRADVLGLLQELPELKPLEADLKRLLSTWFDIGLLHLEEISWENSSAEVLEKLIAYEAVHAIQGWSDLKNRLREDRRCYALFHPNMPSEPLIFVQVALTEGVADNIQHILDQSTPVLDNRKIDAAIFYSISNAQRGLAGISFGNYLIKSAVSLLQSDFPQIKRFSTLSPIPGFKNWCTSQLNADEAASPLVHEVATLLLNAEDIMAVLESVDDPTKNKVLRVAAHYLANEKRTGTFKAKDPVANFHLGNGAMIGQLNWLADTSENGLKQSFGLMVNYFYEAKKIQQRSREYGNKETLPMSNSVRKLNK